MDDRERFEHLLEALREVADLEAASALLDWDEQTGMPPGAAEVRGDQGATVSRLAHERFTRPEVGEWIEALAGFEAAHEPDSFEASLVRVARREYGKAVRVPAELVAALSQATSRAFHAWVEARRSDAFGDFVPHVERVLALVREKADHLGWKGERYDALLDIYEPGYTAADVAELFAGLHAGLRPLLDRIRDASGPGPDGTGGPDGEPLRGSYPEPAQEALGHRVLEAMGFDFRRGRLDRSAHPFTTSIGAPDDVRVTSRYDQADFGPALFAAIHEGGHGLYEQGIPQELRRTPLGTGASLGVHESQSRLWENLVGRSRGFATFLLPLLREAFPGQLAGVDADGLYRGVNRVRPSAIRVEADEVTYNLHILLRFELERALVRGDLPPADLPGAWNEAMERYVGIRPPSDADGVLQDVHWSHGLFGYFPTYALGNLLAATLWQRARAELGDPEAAFASGDFAPLLGWLRRNVHDLGAKLTPKDLVRRVTGGPLHAAPLLGYLEAKYGALYGG